MLFLLFIVCGREWESEAVREREILSSSEEVKIAIWPTLEEWVRENCLKHQRRIKPKKHLQKTSFSVLSLSLVHPFMALCTVDVAWIVKKEIFIVVVKYTLELKKNFLVCWMKTKRNLHRAKKKLKMKSLKCMLKIHKYIHYLMSILPKKSLIDFIQGNFISHNKNLIYFKYLISHKAPI